MVGWGRGRATQLSSYHPSPLQVRNTTVYDFLRKGGDYRPRALLVQVWEGRMSVRWEMRDFSSRWDVR